MLRRYPFYLALENSDEVDYVSEKVFHALEAGVLPVYNGAPNIADFLPPHSVIDVPSLCILLIHSTSPHPIAIMCKSAGWWVGGCRG